jgi:hypothetical protein
MRAAGGGASGAGGITAPGFSGGNCKAGAAAPAPKTTTGGTGGLLRSGAEQLITKVIHNNIKIFIS